MKDIKGKAVRGGISKVIAQIINFSLRIGGMMVLARLLRPEDFGLIAMATVVTSILGLFKDAGLSMATVQRANINDEQMSMLFWINVLVGLILASLLVNFAPSIALAYHEPQLVWVSTVLAVDFLFVGASAQHSALLQRDMRFGIIAVIDIVAQVASLAVAISMAINGWGYWALVGQILATPIVSSVCTWLFVKWIPSWPNPKAKIRSMLSFGGVYTFNWLVVHVAYSLDKFLIGRYIGTGPLGIYGRAAHLISIPQDNISGAIASVAFSTLSRLQDEPERQQRYFLKVYTLLITLTLPITIACAVFAEDMVTIFLGEKWQDAIPIFRLLAPTILIFSLINPFGWFLYATGRARRSLQTAFVVAPLVVMSYLIGLPQGITGIAASYSSVMALWVIPHIVWCIYGTGISFQDMVRTVSRPLLSGFAAALLAFGIQPLIASLPIPFFRLVIECTVMFFCYVFILFYIMGQKSFYQDIFRNLKGK